MKTDYEAAEDALKITLECLLKLIDPFPLSEELRTHRMDAYLEERASIVSWVRENWSETCAEQIETGEHLK